MKRAPKCSLGVAYLKSNLNLIRLLIICAQLILLIQNTVGDHLGSSNLTVTTLEHGYDLDSGFFDWSWDSGNNVTDPTEKGHIRVKRGHGTCVGALGLRRAISSGQAYSVNTAGTNEEFRDRRRRRRRSPLPDPRTPFFDVRGTLMDYALSRIYRRVRPFGEPMQTSTTAVVIPLSIPVNIANAVSPSQTATANSLANSPTRTELAFRRINFDMARFMRFTQSPLIQRDPELRDRFVMDPQGITCEQACRPPGTTFALVGICTTDYCRCGGGATNNELFEYSCAKGQVFDPVRLACRDPRKTELCSDGPKNRQVARTPVSGSSSNSNPNSGQAAAPIPLEQQHFQLRQQQLQLEKQHYELQMQELEVQRQLEKTRLQELGYYPEFDERSPYPESGSSYNSATPLEISQQEQLILQQSQIQQLQQQLEQQEMKQQEQIRQQQEMIQQLQQQLAEQKQKQKEDDSRRSFVTKN